MTTRQTISRGLRAALMSLAAAFAAQAVEAHYLWIEKAGQGRAHVFFGEVKEDAREVTGGRLDDISDPSFRAVPLDGTPRTLRFERRKDHFEVKNADNDLLLVTEETHPVQDLRAHGIGVVKPMFYARTAVNFGSKAPAPALTLDVVPTERSNEFLVFFRNKPLAGEKVMVYAPNLWMRELKTGDDGAVAIETPWPGQYVLDVVHKEPFAGKPFEAFRHRATCTLVR